MKAHIVRSATVVVVVGAFLAVTCFPAGAVEADANAQGKPGAETLVPVPESQVGQIPPPRTRGEINAILKGTDEKAEIRPIHVVLVAGKKDHGPGEHDYPAWQKPWARLLAGAAKTKVTTAWEQPSNDDFESADVMVFFKRTAVTKEMNRQVEAYLSRGGGMVLLHSAVDGQPNAESMERHIGLHWASGCKFRHGWVELAFDGNSDCPILRNLAGTKIRFHDESYWRLLGDASRIEVLATGVEKESEGTVTIPLIWNRQSGKGRVHVNILGHYSWTFNDPLFRILLLRAIAWAAKEPVDRFNDLVAVGVALKD